MTYTPKIEQESIISYDRELDEWHFYSDYPPHCRKWNHLVAAERKVVEKDGRIILLEGTVTGNVIMQKKFKREMTDEQRNAAVERARNINRK